MGKKSTCEFSIGFSLIWSRMRPINAVLLLVIAKFARRLVEVAISLSRRSATRSLTVFSALSHNNVEPVCRCETTIFSATCLFLSSFCPWFYVEKQRCGRQFFSLFVFIVLSRCWKGAFQYCRRILYSLWQRSLPRRKKYDTERISRCVWKSQLHYLGSIQQWVKASWICERVFLFGHRYLAPS